MKKLIDRHVSKLHDNIHILGGSMSVKTDKQSYNPGETVTAAITVNFKKPIKVRGIFAELVCMETHRLKTHVAMDRYDYHLDKELGVEKSTNIRTQVQDIRRTIFSEKKKVAGEGEYATGTFEVQFTLPDDAWATSYEYGHDNKIHKWVLSAKFDVPMTV